MSDANDYLLNGRAGRLADFAVGETVFHVGDPVRRMFFVRSGAIHLIRREIGGGVLIMQRAGAGSVLAEASLYSDAYHCTAQVQVSATVWSVSRDDFQSRLAAEPEFALRWAQRLTREVQAARLHAEILALKTVSLRLDAWIAWRGPLPAKGEWLTVAAEIGVSPEALYREIARRRRTELQRPPNIEKAREVAAARSKTRS